MKRVFDFFASLFLLLLFLPVFFLCSFLVLICSGWPVFFCQTRVGRFQKPFKIIKFRTMRPSPSNSSYLTTYRDSRVTFVGSFLRSYKLDELPQLINVLIGDMSFVGPRPEVPFFLKSYPPDLLPIIFSVRPGITDPSSIRFSSESSLLASVDNAALVYTDEILPLKLSCSAEYISRRTLLSDLFVLLRTIAVVFIARAR